MSEIPPTKKIPNFMQKLIYFKSFFVILILKIAELLLENGADVNLVNERGSSPLLVVCQYNNLSK